MLAQGSPKVPAGQEHDCTRVPGDLQQVGDIGLRTAVGDPHAGGVDLSDLHALSDERALRPLPALRGVRHDECETDGETAAMDLDTPYRRRPDGRRRAVKTPILRLS